MNKPILFALLTALLSTSALAADNMLSIESDFSVDVTANRLEGILVKKGMTLFNRIEHAKNADKVNIPLRPTQLLIFGNPKVGSPLMQCAQTVALDLPQKALIWQDDSNTVWVSYNDPSYLAKRHKMTGCEKNIAKISNALANITRAAAKNE